MFPWFLEIFWASDAFSSSKLSTIFLIFSHSSDACAVDLFDFIPAPDAEVLLKVSCSLDKLPWLLRANRNSSRRSCCSVMQRLLPVNHTRNRRYINKNEQMCHYCTFIYAPSLSSQIHETSSQWLLLHQSASYNTE